MAADRMGAHNTCIVQYMQYHDHTKILLVHINNYCIIIAPLAVIDTHTLVIVHSQTFSSLDFGPTSLLST